MKKTVTHWIPAAICGFVVFFAAMDSGNDARVLILLLVCFGFVGLAISQMRGEIHRLQEQIAKLQRHESA